MAEHPGAMGPGEFDLAGFAVGAVERDAMLGADRVGVGDVLVGLASPGLRSNGYSLARHVLLERAGAGLDAPGVVRGRPHPGRRAAAALGRLRPGRARRRRRRPMSTPAAHITGGGLPGNLARVLPPGCDAEVERGAGRRRAIFAEIQRLGDVDDDEMARVFNLGLGMVLVVAPDGVDAAWRRSDRRRAGGDGGGADRRRDRARAAETAVTAVADTGGSATSADGLEALRGAPARPLGAHRRLRPQVGSALDVVHRLQADRLPSRGHAARGRGHARCRPRRGHRHRRADHGGRPGRLRHRRGGGRRGAGP